MATQYKPTQDRILSEAKPQSLYELLIYDNQKLASKSEGPHIILRRTRKGEEPYKPDLSPPFPVMDEAQLEAQEATNQKETEDQQLIGGDEVAPISNNNEPAKGPEERGENEENKSEFVGASAISNYLASLSNHVQSDVLRVVDAIIELEKDVPVKRGNIEEGDLASKEELTGVQEADAVQESTKTSEEAERIIDKNEAIVEETEFVQGSREELEDEDKKKSIDIADIFKSLKNARKRATQKSYSYTKKVEYEDH